MKIIRIILLLLVYCNLTTAENLYIKNFKPELYLGKWFEIGRFPLYFERNCIAPITAEYRIENDNLIVKNSCKNADGKLEVANGIGYFSESSSIGKLTVTFLPGWLRFTHLGRGDYWILYTDYKYALVGSPDYKYLWILSRSETYDKNKVASLIDMAKHKGYDTTKLKLNY